MSELKTLKDMEKSDIEIGFIVEVIELKQEAIKWVKKKIKKSQKTWRFECRMMIDFLNITEEDLK